MCFILFFLSRVGRGRRQRERGVKGRGSGENGMLPGEEGRHNMACWEEMSQLHPPAPPLLSPLTTKWPLPRFLLPGLGLWSSHTPSTKTQDKRGQPQRLTSLHLKAVLNACSFSFRTAKRNPLGKTLFEVLSSNV